MKKLIIILIALSFLSVCFAASIQDMHRAVIARRNAGGGGGGCTYIYSASGEPPFTSNDQANTNAVAIETEVDTGMSGTATSIGFYIYANSTASNCKVALYAENGLTLVNSGGTVSSLTVPGWNDVTISEAVSDQIYYVAFECDGNWTASYEWAACYSSWDDEAYSTFPANPFTSSWATYSYCQPTRICIE